MPLVYISWGNMIHHYQPSKVIKGLDVAFYFIENAHLFRLILGAFSVINYQQIIGYLFIEYHESLVLAI